MKYNNSIKQGKSGGQTSQRKSIKISIAHKLLCSKFGWVKRLYIGTTFSFPLLIFSNCAILGVRLSPDGSPVYSTMMSMTAKSRFGRVNQVQRHWNTSWDFSKQITLFQLEDHFQLRLFNSYTTQHYLTIKLAFFYSFAVDRWPLLIAHPFIFPRDFQFFCSLLKSRRHTPNPFQQNPRNANEFQRKITGPKWCLVSHAVWLSTLQREQLP